MKNKLPKVLASGVTLLSFPIVAFAQTENLWDEINKDLEGSDQGVGPLIVRVLNWMIGAAAVICVVMLVVGGYSYMTAGGDENKVKTATKTLTNAIIGLAICFIAVMLVNFVLDTFLNGGANETSLLMTFLA
jgi:TRAP-type C4-dicarboxylate transport system permease small subunit